MGERALYRIALALVALCALAPPAVQATEALARKNNCLNCHDVERKKIGPGFKQVAERYAGQKDAAARLAERIVNGGSGAWGPVAMPANALSREEALRLAQWVLATK